MLLTAAAIQRPLDSMYCRRAGLGSSPASGSTEPVPRAIPRRARKCHPPNPHPRGPTLRDSGLELRSGRDPPGPCRRRHRTRLRDPPLASPTPAPRLVVRSGGAHGARSPEFKAARADFSHPHLFASVAPGLGGDMRATNRGHKAAADRVSMGWVFIGRGWQRRMVAIHLRIGGRTGPLGFAAAGREMERVSVSAGPSHGHPERGRPGTPRRRLSPGLARADLLRHDPAHVPPPSSPSSCWGSGSAW